MGLDYSMQLIMSGVLNVTQVRLSLFPPQTSNLVSFITRLCVMDFFEPSSFKSNLV